MRTSLDAANLSYVPIFNWETDRKTGHMTRQNDQLRLSANRPWHQPCDHIWDAAFRYIRGIASLIFPGYAVEGTQVIKTLAGCRAQPLHVDHRQVWVSRSVSF